MNWFKSKPQADAEVIVETVSLSADSREFWKSSFDSALHGLLDYEMRIDAKQAQLIAASASAVADAALDAYERRWPR